MLVIIVLLATLLSLGAALLGSMSLVPRLAKTTETMSATDSLLPNIAISDLYFHEGFDYNLTDRDICLGDTNRVVIMEITYDLQNIPESCTLQVDDKLVKYVHIKDLPCGADCSKQASLLVDVRAQNIFNRHNFELCCEGSCTSSYLEPLCS